MSRKIESEDEDKTLREMKVNLQDSLMVFVQEEQGGPVPSYSPTQSPLVISPTSPFDSPPPLSPTGIPLPGLPPLPPPPLLPSPNSLPRPPPPLSPPPPSPLSPPPLVRQPPAVVLPPPVFAATGLSLGGEPLPPGDEEHPAAGLLSLFRPLPPPPPCPPRLNMSAQSTPQDMELVDSPGDDAAETRFFQDQAAIVFPASVWGFVEKPPSVVFSSTAVSEEEAMEAAPPPQGGSRSGRKRQESTRKEERAKKRRISSGNKTKGDEDEETALRALLLSQVRPKSTPDTGANKENTAVHEEAPRIPPSLPVHIKADTLPVKSSGVTPAASSTAVGSRQEGTLRRQGAAAVKKAERKVSRAGRKGVPAAKLNISQVDRAKHFPNLTKKLVIPLTQRDSDTEEEEKEMAASARVSKTAPSAKVDKTAPSARTGEDFCLNLDSFLKQVRSATTGERRSAQRGPAGKDVTPQMKARAKALTPADKRKLISSNISHLPLEQQREYIRLKLLIARKEQLKVSGKLRAGSIQQQQQQLVKSRNTTPDRVTRTGSKLVAKSGSSGAKAAPPVKQTVNILSSPVSSSKKMPVNVSSGPGDNKQTAEIKPLVNVPAGQGDKKTAESKPLISTKKAVNAAAAQPGVDPASLNSPKKVAAVAAPRSAGAGGVLSGTADSPIKIVEDPDTSAQGEDEDELRLRIALLDELKKNLQKRGGTIDGVLNRAGSLPTAVSLTPGEKSSSSAGGVLAPVGSTNMISTHSKMTVKVLLNSFLPIFQCCGF